MEKLRLKEEHSAGSCIVTYNVQEFSHRKKGSRSFSVEASSFLRKHCARAVQGTSAWQHAKKTPAQ
jgi:hypothetical protein